MTPTIQKLALADRSTREDLRNYLQRLVRVGEAEVRLQTRGSALAVYGCTQTPQGLLDDTAVVLVMRAFALEYAPDEMVDMVVEARSLTDRLARMGEGDEGPELALMLPDAQTSAAWAGVLPPTSGWERRGTIDARSLAVVAQEGMSRVAQSVPTDAGDPVVQQVRRAVWGSEIAPGLPAAVAFAAEGLGFLHDADQLSVTVSRSWTRLSAPHGYVLLRGGSAALGVI